MSKFADTEENRAKIDTVGESLLGTASSLDDELQKEFGEDAEITDFDTALLQRLDDHTMQCEACGWWCETGELDDNQECDDCTRDKEDDDE